MILVTGAVEVASVVVANMLSVVVAIDSLVVDIEFDVVATEVVATIVIEVSEVEVAIVVGVEISTLGVTATVSVVVDETVTVSEETTSVVDVVIYAVCA